MKYTALEYSLYAEINGQIVDVLRAMCAYELNRIPKATIVVPLGVNAHTLQQATSATVLGGTALQLPVKLYLEIGRKSGATNSEAIVPKGKYLLFEGFVTGIGYRQLRGQLGLSADLTHWLSGLSFASALSESSHPSNPADLTAPPHIIPPGDAVGGGMSMHWLNKTLVQASIHESDVKEDLWGKVLYPWFVSLTQANRMLFDPELFGPVAKNDSKNREAAAALSRFVGDKLPFDTKSDDGKDADIAAQIIADDISLATSDPASTAFTFAAMANTTLWDKLVGDLAQRYLFSVVPYPDRAKVVPMIPGLREVYKPRHGKYTIAARDVLMLDTTSYLQRPLRAVGMLSGLVNDAGFAMAGGDPLSSRDQLYGMFLGRDDGMVMFKRAPRYLAGTGIAWLGGAAAAGVAAVKSTAMHPRAGEDGPAIGKLPTWRKARKAMLDRLAHALYVYESIRGRVGSLVSPVRFDISPGSNISIEGTENWVGHKDKLAGKAKIATVSRVSYTFNGEQGVAQTTYQLSHVRTEEENEKETMSIDRHPLYDRKWLGDTLVPLVKDAVKPKPPK